MPAAPAPMTMASQPLSVLMAAASPRHPCACPGRVEVARTRHPAADGRGLSGDCLPLRWRRLASAQPSPATHHAHAGPAQDLAAEDAGATAAHGTPGQGLFGRACRVAVADLQPTGDRSLPARADARRPFSLYAGVAPRAGAGARRRRNLSGVDRDLLAHGQRGRLGADRGGRERGRGDAVLARGLWRVVEPASPLADKLACGSTWIERQSDAEAAAARRRTRGAGGMPLGLTRQ